MEETKTKIDISFYDLENLKPLEDNSIFINLKENIKTKDFIIENYGEEGKDNDCDLKNAKLIIAFARMKDLHNKNTYNNLVNGSIRWVSDFKDTKSKDNYNPLPIIVLGVEKFWDELKFDLKNEKDKDKQEDIKKQIEIVKNLNLDQRVTFFDSSIWHRYVPLNDKFEENFKSVIKEIVEYQNKKLYQTSVAREFLEFKTRMMVNSYLAPVGAHAHATHLIPYKFHSESLVRSQFIQEKNKVKDKLKDLRWKFLLIDDYAFCELKKYNDLDKNPKKSDPPEKCYSEGIPTKACILKTILEDILCENNANINKVSIKVWEENWENDNKNNSILLCVESIEEAKKALKNEMFDIIFLDYLFSEDKNLGSELLVDITKDDRKELRNNIGPFGKFWIFPISAFSYAMMDDLRERGLGYENEYWHISAGSDPINTPWLFKYKLIKFMKKQINMIKPITYFLRRLKI